MKAAVVGVRTICAPKAFSTDTYMYTYMQLRTVSIKVGSKYISKYIYTRDIHFSEMLDGPPKHLDHLTAGFDSSINFCGVLKQHQNYTEIQPSMTKATHITVQKY